MPDITTLALVVLAFSFDFVNGFHDAANSIATIVSTRVLSPLVAVAWAAFFNFIAFAVFGLAVAGTIGKGIIDPAIVDKTVVFSALIGGVSWDLITWYSGLPSSSSHALIGGLIGAAVMKALSTSQQWSQNLIWVGISKVALFIVISPVAGCIIGFLILVLVHWIFQKAKPGLVSAIFKRGQFLSASYYSIGHGGGDAQKTMGIVSMLLVSGGYYSPEIYKHGAASFPLWIVLTSHAIMGLGTLAGGWRIVKTMGQRITHLRPVDGFSAEAGAGTALFITTQFGIPVSTTHTITGGIVGVGAARRFNLVKWGVTARIIWAWVLTIPASAAIAALTFYVIKLVS